MITCYCVVDPCVSLWLENEFKNQLIKDKVTCQIHVFILFEDSFFCHMPTLGLNIVFNCHLHSNFHTFKASPGLLSGERVELMTWWL